MSKTVKMKTMKLQLLETYLNTVRLFATEYHPADANGIWLREFLSTGKVVHGRLVAMTASGCDMRQLHDEIRSW
jgi:hypothetical protein